MALYCKSFLFLLFIVTQNQFSKCALEDFEANVDGFMDAFENAFPTETHSQSADDLGEENEVPLEGSSITEAPNTNEEPVDEAIVVTDKVLALGDDVTHELTDEVRALAERVLATISTELQLINVTKAVSTPLVDKVQRRLSLVVTPKDCEEGSSCELMCRVELISSNEFDEVTWHNCLDTPNGNEVMRAKRGAIGGFKQVEDDEAKELGEVALQTLDSIDADDTKRVITKVLRAQKQLVNGIMYHLTLEVASSDCKEGSERCDGKLSDYNICKILMQRHFSGEAPHNAQVIKSECSPRSKNNKIEDKKRAKRNTDDIETNHISDMNIPKEKPHHQDRMMGGITKQDPNSEKIIELSQFAVSEIDKSTNSLNKQKVVRIVDARSQVVSGAKYFLKLELVETDCRKGSNQAVCNPVNKPIQSCDLVIWEKPWKRFRTITRVNCAPEQARKKRALGLVGGRSPADPNSPQVQEMAKFAVDQLDAKTNSQYKQKLVVVKKAASQVVAGANYFLTIQLVETTCPKGSSADSACNAAPGKVLQECDVVVYDRSWDKHREMTSANCSSVSDAKKVYKRSLGLVGGRSPADTNSAQVQEMAKFAVDQLDAKTNSQYKQKLVVVKKAATQVVAGANYFLTIVLVETTCPKGSSADSVCNAAPGKVLQECDVVVYDRSWDKHREMTSANCSSAPDTKQVHKREVMPGGLADADPNAANIQEVAHYAVSQLDARSNSMYKQKLVRVTKAQTQVVAGTNYYLTLHLVETTCRKGSPANSVCDPAPGKVLQECVVVVYDRPWDKHREVTSFKFSPTPSNKRHKRGLAGGRKDADRNNAQVQQMAQFALSQLDDRSNSLNKQRIVTIKKAQTQTVAGTNYFLTLDLEETNCRKGSPANSECTAVPGKALQVCEVVVYDKPWEHLREMTSADCSPSPDNKQVHKRSPEGILVGAPQPQEKDSAEIQELAQFAVEDLNKKSNSVNKQVLVEVVSAHTQVVAGLKYLLKLRVAESDCKKHGNLAASNCVAKTDVVPQECEVTVWSQPWLNERQVLKSNCHQVQDKEVNHEARHADPLAPEVLDAARFSLKAIDRSSNSMYKHALIRVVDAKVKDDSGKKYFLTVEIGESECTKRHSGENCNLRVENSLSETCKVVVWDRPAPHKKEVLDVQCGLRRKRSIISGPKTQKELDLDRFELFKQTYNKTYSDEMEHHRRFRIFRANLKKIEALQLNEQGTATYGPTMFADLSRTEFRQKYLGLKQGPPPKTSSHHMVPAQVPYVNNLPTDFDWRDHNAVTPVKNQGQCGSCWAFSVTGNIEGQMLLRHGRLISLSEQELVDCDKSDNGCNGGYMTVAYESIEKLGGLELEDQYPYDAKVEQCKFNQTDVQATVTGSVNITSNETEMVHWLVANGPISIGINANAMQFYMGGVSHPFKFLCNKNDLDHGVLLVGYGVHNYPMFHKSLPFWIIKNSWGPKWGEQGYYRVYRGDGTCGVNKMASSAIVG